MQLVRRGDAAAFELVYERHSGAAFSLAYRMAGNAQRPPRTSSRRPSSTSGAPAPATTAPAGRVRTWMLGIVHHRAIDALRRAHRPRPAPRRDEGIEERLEARERTDVEAARREEAREVRVGAGGAARRAAPGDRARLLRRLHPQRDRGDARRRRWARSRAGCDSGWASCAARSAAWPRSDVMSGREHCVTARRRRLRARRPAPRRASRPSSAHLALRACREEVA